MKTKLTIEESVKLLPNASGVYLMHDKNDEIIYIGKAKNLKKRVKSYFQKNHDSAKLVVMVPQIIRFDFIITDSEVEALILESHLIKKHKPKYNVLLKDDKRFPWFLITDELYPRIIVTRKADKKLQKGKYFGPYTNARAMYSTLDLIKKMFPLKQCKTPRFKDRPCMYHQIRKCLGPCQKLVSSEDYKEIVKQVEMFLSGKQTELLAELKHQMEVLAEKEEFEKAARYRDSYFDVMKAVGKQKVVSENTDINQDIIGFARDNAIMSIALLKVRDGRLIAKEDFDIRLDEIHTPYEALIAFIQEYYQLVDVSEIPKELLLSSEIEEDESKIIKEWLTLKKGSKVNLLTPNIDSHASTRMIMKHELVEMANKNAISTLESLKISEMANLQNDWNEIGCYIQEKLNLLNFPNRIECFDISHIQGTNTVASMVVFINGKPYKSEYRKYKIRTLAEGQTDDFASMKEVIKRRYQKLLRDKEQVFPDLIIVDGGKGQLSSTLESLEELGLSNMPIVSLAKKFEEIYLPEQSNPVVFPTNSKALFLFQQVRDEAHRFAVSYHRKLREKNAIKSILDDISTLQISHKKLLVEHFGDINGIMEANKSELSRVIGKTQGAKVYSFLHKKTS
ncbi:MAG: excinuclease ABC subunit C [Candidatus Melainabacteria bacterium GWF2_32_7]|nr:MAG: excinuclease ABC subunit C [Candidatus Melainabacteria bacterium GWF2_32_7]